ncbi:MAG: glycosyltransferase family 2 protein [Planctomycetota bacterium]|nr:MAG: glycosyltransferase family 2 protein [Planctomycetota bacterium]
MPRVLLAIPVFNEAKSVDRVLTAVKPYIHDILMVDDGSTDETPARLAAHSVEVIRHCHNRGYGRSMQDIFHAADADGYGWVITMDCDEQHSPASIPEFLEAIRADNTDVISGSRYLRASPEDTDAPGRRREVNMTLTAEINARLGAVLAASGARAALGTGITDAFCGFKAYRVASLRTMSLDVDGYDFPLQFWVQAVAHGLRVDEIPVPRIYVDPNRSFGVALDDPTRRLALYRATFERELARCAGRIRLASGSVA